MHAWVTACSLLLVDMSGSVTTTLRGQLARARGLAAKSYGEGAGRREGSRAIQKL
jgi:hypothetical protein